MSKLKLFFIGLNAVVWIAVGFFGFQKYTKKSEAKNIQTSYMPKMGKLQRALDVNLKWVELSDSTSGVSKVLVEVVPLEPFESDLNYQWVLPPGASLLNGSESGIISGVVSTNFEVELIGLSSEEFATTILQVSGEFNGNTLGSAGAIATRAQKLQSLADTAEKLRD